MEFNDVLIFIVVFGLLFAIFVILIAFVPVEKVSQTVNNVK